MKQRQCHNHTLYSVRFSRCKMRKMEDFKCFQNGTPKKEYQLDETLKTLSKDMLVKNLGTDNITWGFHLLSGTHLETTQSNS